MCGALCCIAQKQTQRSLNRFAHFDDTCLSMRTDKHRCVPWLMMSWDAKSNVAGAHVEVCQRCCSKFCILPCTYIHSIGAAGVTAAYSASSVAYKLQVDCMTRHSKPSMAMTCVPGVHLQAAALAMRALFLLNTDIYIDPLYINTKHPNPF